MVSGTSQTLGISKTVKAEYHSVIGMSEIAAKSVRDLICASSSVSVISGDMVGHIRTDAKAQFPCG